jgi:hypothetical protein
MDAMKHAILNEVFEESPAGTLYHYTDQEGFLGIIGKKHIWATHTQYLNDRREFRHAVDLVGQEIDEQLEATSVGGVTDRSRQFTLEKMRRALQLPVWGANVCVCSFSESVDSLSQWRAYGGSSGFALGFSGKFLRAALAPQGQRPWLLAKCIYNFVEQQELVRALVREVADEIINGVHVEVDDSPSFGAGNLLRYLAKFAPVLKHESFRDEQEWRIISPANNHHDEHFDYRPGRSSIIPYAKLRLCGVNEPLQLDTVIVGPTSGSEHALSAAIGFLMKNDVMMGSGDASYAIADIRSSAVPYRDW